MIDRVSQTNIQSMLETIRAYQTQSAGSNLPVGEAAPGAIKEQPKFFESVKNALDSVNEAQGKSRKMQEAYERGEEVPLTEVVLSMQKSSLSFEATLQVRNKVLKAYEDILNMPV